MYNHQCRARLSGQAGGADECTLQMYKMTRQIHHLLSEIPPSTISQTNQTAKLNFDLKMGSIVVIKDFNLKHFSFQE